MKKFLDNLKSSGKLKVEETDIHFWINDQEITSKLLPYFNISKMKQNCSFQLKMARFPLP